MTDLAQGAARKLDAHVWEREVNDHYVEPAWCSARLFQEEKFEGGIYDPCCGFGTIVIEALKAGFSAYGSDLIDRGWDSTRTPYDFIRSSEVEMHDNIVCNPPFTGDAIEQFIKRALTVTRRKVAAIVPTGRLHAAHWLKETPLARVWLMTPRPSMPPGYVIARGEKPGGGKMDFCWLVWSKGRVGPADLRWLRRDGEPS